ncbi:MAG TPA: hypothetical protein VIS71_09080, partial [Terrimicrobium sp.]
MPERPTPRPDPTQRAAVAVEALPFFKKQAGSRMLAGRQIDPNPELGRGSKGKASSDAGISTTQPIATNNLPPLTLNSLP